MTLVVNGQLRLGDFHNTLYKSGYVSIDPAALSRVSDNHSFLADFSADKLIYGINTGLGPMAQFKVKPENLIPLQYNLIRSHSSGTGGLIEPIGVKAIMLARLNTLMLGYSGIHPSLPELLVSLINQNVYPCIFQHGSVGASGDLVQLAHLALVLIGEGKVMFEEKIHPAMDVFKKLSIEPLTIKIREALAIMNGTSAMTGIGIVNLLKANKLLYWSILLSAMTNEVVEAFDDHFSHELNAVKKHPGQSYVARMMRDILKDSQMIRKRSDHLYTPESLERDTFEDKIQEYYSLRCISQVLGPVLDTITHAENVLINEVNSVNDNPIIDHLNHNVFHGGNFHGDYVALEMDKLKIAITKLSMLSERQLNYLLNDKLNKKFPPFMNLGTLGFNFGMQGVQFTATSTVAENQTLCFPMYIHSIPNNNDNQDIVSMGTNAALLTKKVIENCFEVLAVQMMTVLQAIDYLRCERRLSTSTHSIYTTIRKIFPKFVDDQPKYEDLLKIRIFFEKSDRIFSYDDGSSR